MTLNTKSFCHGYLDIEIIGRYYSMTYFKYSACTNSILQTIQEGNRTFKTISQRTSSHMFWSYSNSYKTHLPFTSHPIWCPPCPCFFHGDQFVLFTHSWMCAFHWSMFKLSWAIIWEKATFSQQLRIAKSSLSKVETSCPHLHSKHWFGLL